MKCTPETKWKYLRETNSRFFDPNMNTTLQDYLFAIFPNRDFEYNSAIKKSEIPDDVPQRRYICDAIDRENKLIVEFDGVNHYMDTKICIKDIERDIWFGTIGYKTIRIPYWIQLSQQVIKELFDVDVENEFCQLNYSFYHPETDTIDVNVFPGNMCELGRDRFIREYNSFSKDIRIQIGQDLITCMRHISDRYFSDCIFPKSIYDRMYIPEIVILEN